jgi:hypothetical protein
MARKMPLEKKRKYSLHNCDAGAPSSSVLVAVEAGLGVSLLPCLATKGRTVKIYEELGRERPMALSVYGWETSGRIGDLVAKMTALLAERAASAG